MGIWESFETFENSEFDYKGQNILSWSVLYTIRKVLKCKCRNWPRMCHSDISSINYTPKKGQESNWQFDSRPLKVKNRPDLDVCRWSVTHHWKSLERSYKFALDLHSIVNLSKELWTPKVPRFQTGIVLRLLLGNLGKKCHLNASAAGKHIEYYMGEGDDFPWVRVVMNHVSQGSPVACPNTKSVPKCELTNLLVGLMQVRITK
jgi:hypothetical protein